MGPFLRLSNPKTWDSGQTHLYLQSSTQYSEKSFHAFRILVWAYDCYLRRGCGNGYLSGRVFPRHRGVQLPQSAADHNPSTGKSSLPAGTCREPCYISTFAHLPGHWATSLLASNRRPRFWKNGNWFIDSTRVEGISMLASRTSLMAVIICCIRSLGFLPHSPNHRAARIHSKTQLCLTFKKSPTCGLHRVSP